MMDYWIYTLVSLSITMKTGFSMEITKLFRPGEEIKLPCVASDMYSMHWLFYPNAENISSKTLTENRNVNEKYKNINIVGNLRSDYHLQISNITEKDEGLYTCIKSGNNNGTVYAKFSLKMKVAPSEIQIFNLNGNSIAVGYEDKELHLVCNAKGGFPEGKLYWKETDITSNRTSCIWPWANVTFVPQHKDDGKILTCAATHKMFDRDKEVSVKLSVRYKPKIDILRHPKGAIIEGDKIELKCRDQSNPPKTNITWKNDGHILSFESEYIIAKSRINDSGIYTCTAVNIVGLVEKDVLILVNKSTTSSINTSCLEQPGQCEILEPIMIYVLVCLCMTLLFCSTGYILPKYKKGKNRVKLVIQMKQ